MAERFTGTSGEWNALVGALPEVHVLQTWEWGQVKAAIGWQPLPYIWRNAQGQVSAAALILQRTIPIGGFAARLRMLYIPKGPLCDWSDVRLRRQVLGDVGRLARQQGAFFVKIDPDVLLGMGVPGEADAQENPVGQALLAEMQAEGWCFSHEQVQFRNTVLIDLKPDLETLLANMKQKTRYNIRLAERKGVTVRVGGEKDIPLLYRMYAETSVRDDFVIRDEAYYRWVWSAFFRAGMAEPLIAEAMGEPLAALVLFHFAGRAWYLYGMSRETQREKMPNYLLQWEAIRRARVGGCHTYDLWGAPDEFHEGDAMWGVYRFKDGLGGKVARSLGAWDLPIQPLLYRLYTKTLPRLLDVMRWRGKGRTQRGIGG